VQDEVHRNIKNTHYNIKYSTRIAVNWTNASRFGDRGTKSVYGAWRQNKGSATTTNTTTTTTTDISFR